MLELGIKIPEGTIIHCVGIKGGCLNRLSTVCDPCNHSVFCKQCYDEYRSTAVCTFCPVCLDPAEFTEVVLEASPLIEKRAEDYIDEDYIDEVYNDDAEMYDASDDDE